ncbi:hypothetical protein JL720_8828 [Aureococcus anophagefferens]|nr:hypothetical protein JL720_8828 [Aureococcus anophagefferens]
MGKPPWLPVVAALSLATTTARNSLCADYCAAANSDACCAICGATDVVSIHNAYERSSGRAIGDGLYAAAYLAEVWKPTVTPSPSPQAADPPAEMTEGPVDAAPGTAPNSTQTSPQNSPVGRVPQESPSVRARVKTWEANNPKKQIITFGRPPSSRSPSPSLEPRTVAKPPPPLPVEATLAPVRATSPAVATSLSPSGSLASLASLSVRDDVSVASGLGTPHETDDDAEWTTVRIRNRKTGEATAVRVKKGTDVRELVDRYASSKNKAGRVRVTNVTKKAVPCPTRPLERLSSKVWKEEAPPLPPAPVRRPGFLALAVIGLAAGAGAGLGFVGYSRSAKPPAAARPLLHISGMEAALADARAARDALNRSFVAERRGHEAAVAAARAEASDARAPPKLRHAAAPRRRGGPRRRRGGGRRKRGALGGRFRGPRGEPRRARARRGRGARLIASAPNAATPSPSRRAPSASSPRAPRRRSCRRCCAAPRGSPRCFCVAPAPVVVVGPRRRASRRCRRSTPPSPRRPGRPPPRAVPPPGPSCRPGPSRARRRRRGSRRRRRAAAAAEPRPRGERALIHAPLAFLNGLFAGGEEKRRPGAASRLAGIAVAAAFILAPDDGRTW